ncbi:Rab-like protein 6 [Gryganskiella cystojenkinii]|nr:Rab-like protein 6 [Gryganskiella cystojenkinii]
MFHKLWPFNSKDASQANGTSQSHNEPEDHGVSTKVKPIHASFNKGIPLNMKIVLRGDIRTGKTSLFERLQGHPFRPGQDYRTTEQIQVANIPWQYPQTKDIIKVEIWDVVDKGVQSGELKSTASGGTLKMEHNAPTSPSKSKLPGDSADAAPHAGFALDASTIDVYRNTDGVILLYDVSKPWTFEYAKRALNEMPTNIPVLILSNFSDDSNPRPVIAGSQVEELMEEHNEERYKHPCAPANLVRHLDSSMKTGLGLKEIHESFGIPFLNVLRETHRKQFDQKTFEIGELLRTLDGKTQDRSSQPSAQRTNLDRTNSNNSSAIVSPKANQSSKILPHSNITIQTSGPAMNASIAVVPQSSSPTSPARKTRNDHTNVDILSPHPVSAQTPAVLFDFNSGKLEDEFFHNVDLDSNAPAPPPPTAPSNPKTATTAAVPFTSAPASVVRPVVAPSSTTSFQSVNLNKDSMDSNDSQPYGNPMVAADEDIGDSSRDELADVSTYHSPPLQPPGWGPGQIEKELLSRHHVVLNKNANESEDDIFLEKKAAKPIEDEDEDDDDLQGVDLNQQGTRHSYHVDSDEEDGQPTFPVASAMYYEHETSGFAQDDHSDDIGTTSSTAPITAPMIDIDSSLAGYKEVTSAEQGKNPWGSNGDLLSTTTTTTSSNQNVASLTVDSLVDVEEVKTEEAAPKEQGQDLFGDDDVVVEGGHGTADGSTSSDVTQVEDPMVDLLTAHSKPQQDVEEEEVSVPVLSPIVSEETSPTLTTGTESGSAVNAEDDDDDEEAESPVVDATAEGGQGEKKKPKKKNKKKGKKGK